MKKRELVFIPIPGISHLVSMVEAAKLLLDLDGHLLITVLLIKPPYEFESNVRTYIQSSGPATPFSERIRFIDVLPKTQDELINIPPAMFIAAHYESLKPQVKEVIITRSNDSVLAGFVVDMFSTSMMDLAAELGVPSYGFFTSGAAFLGLLFDLQTLHDNQNFDFSEHKDSDAELLFPGFDVNPLLAKVLPCMVIHQEWVPIVCNIARTLRGSQGIMVNTFMELESHALDSLSNAQDIPPVYPVGPILNLKGDGRDQRSVLNVESDIMKWLDDQPLCSVVFLCFGSMGSFGGDQVKEIACALEQSGHRFLWSLRKPQSKDVMSSTIDYSNLEGVLPEGFLDRTAKTGKVIGWAPQVRVLAHAAIGGFVSHCGWNSVLESIWFGVPIATWPLHAEQQFNAFQLVRELGLAVEIKMDYKKEPRMATADDIKRGIVGVMEKESDVRKRVREMSEKSRKASVADGGSSNSFLRHFISNVLNNVP